MQRRVDLVQATMQGWSRLDDRHRQRFAEGFLKAALRLDRLEFRAWLLRRVRTAPLAAPVDPACYAISEGDLALVLKTLERRHRRQRSRITDEPQRPARV
jgi:hypothetical protein